MALMTSLAAVVCAQSGRPITVVVDGSPVVFTTQQPMMSDARVLVPLRGVFEKLGASVGWDPATQSITATTRSTTVKLSIGQLDASVNNQPVHMDIPATLVGGTTMVPLRFVSEALGAVVGWNPANQEVDIKSKADYGFPTVQDRDRDREKERERERDQARAVERDAERERLRQIEIQRDIERQKAIALQKELERQRDRDRDRDRNHQQAPPVDYIDFTPDSVIPFVLQTRLNSANAQVGDQFTAFLATKGSPDYFGLPGNTIAYGSVSYVRSQNGRDPGVIELIFDHITLPNGKTIPINGKICDMRAPGVVRLPDGSMAVRGAPRHDHAMFTGYGAGAGVIVGVMSKKVVVDADINGLIGRFARPEHKTRPASNVELRPGTMIAIRLDSDLKFRRDLR